jgi:hypothetical protein
LGIIWDLGFGVWKINPSGVDFREWLLLNYIIIEVGAFVLGD